MPFIWNPTPQIPAPTPPEPIPETATTFKVHVVANTVNAGGTVLYNTSPAQYDVIYEFPSLNVGLLVARSLNTSFANITSANITRLNSSFANITSANITSLNLITGTILTAPSGNLDIVNKLYVTQALANVNGGSGGPIVVNASVIFSNSANGSILISNTVSGKFDERRINVHPSILIENGMGRITLTATGDPILSGHRYGSAWISTLDQLPSANFAHLTSVAFGGAGAGRYVAVGINELEPGNSGFSIISFDAVNWSNRIFMPANLLKLVWTGYLFVGVGESGLVMTSADGVIWTQRVGTSGDWYGLVWNGSTLVAVGPGANVMTSPDGITWTIRTHSGGSGWKDVTWFAGLFVAVGDGGKMMTSPNGITWTARPTGGDPFSPATALACVTAGSTVVVAAGIGFIQYSANGIVYTGTPYPGTFTGTAEALTFGSGTYVGVGTDVMTSADGITWVDRTPAVSTQMSDVIYAGGLFVAVGRWVMTSPDGITWTDRYVPPIGRQAIAWNGSTFAAVSGDGVRTSPNGVVWTLNSAIASDWRSVAWSGTVFAAVGTSSVMTSPDGVVWTSRTSVAGSWQSIAWNGTVFAAVGPGIVQTSPDGITWTSRSSVGGSWNGITWNGIVFVAVGPSIVQTSPDGITWTSRTAAVGAWIDVAWNNNVFAAIGTNVAMTSPDGNVWTSRTAANGSWVAIEWDGSVFAAVGSDSRVMTSPDGVHWTRRTNAPSGIWQDLAWSGNVFAVVSGDANTNTAIMTNHYDAVTSVVGRVGRVILNTNDVSENAIGPLYFTNERARLALSSIFPISYDSLTGIFSHANSGVVAATYGNASFVPVTTVDVQGHVTSVVNTSISVSAAQITSGILAVARGGTGKDATGLVNGAILIGNTINTGYDIAPITQTAPIIVTNSQGGIRLSHAASGVVASTYGNAIAIPVVTVDGNGHLTTVTTVPITGVPAATANGQLLIGNTVSGGFDVSTIAQTTPIIVTLGQGTIRLSHAASGVTAGVYGNATLIPSITVDANGHLTAVTNTAVSTLPPATANGQLLIGNTVSGGFDVNTLTAGNNIIVANGMGTITISVPALMPTGNGNNRMFYENDQNVTGNYTITTGKSAMSTGPVTINPGVFVTLPPGSRWVLV
jgi:hypothetical protein